MNTEQIQCPECSKMYESEDEFLSHLQSRHPPSTSFQCASCHEIFGSMKLLEWHRNQCSIVIQLRCEQLEKELEKKREKIKTMKEQFDRLYDRYQEAKSEAKKYKDLVPVYASSSSANLNLQMKQISDENQKLKLDLQVQKQVNQQLMDALQSWRTLPQQKHTTMLLLQPLPETVVQEAFNAILTKQINAIEYKEVEWLITLVKQVASAMVMPLRKYMYISDPSRKTVKWTRLKNDKPKQFVDIRASTLGSWIVEVNQSGIHQLIEHLEQAKSEEVDTDVVSRYNMAIECWDYLRTEKGSIELGKYMTNDIWTKTQYEDHYTGTQ